MDPDPEHLYPEMIFAQCESFTILFQLTSPNILPKILPEGIYYSI
jgi:hypothetical protein